MLFRQALARRRASEGQKETRERSISTSDVVLLVCLLFVVLCGGCASLPEAARRDNLGRMERLLAKGASPETRDLWSQTALHNVRSLDGARLLIAYHADVNATNRSGMTPLHLHVENAAIVDELVNHGAKVDAEDMVGLTPLDCALWLHNDDTFGMLFGGVVSTPNDCLESIGGLIAHGAQLDGCGGRLRWPALHWAVKQPLWSIWSIFAPAEIRYATEDDIVSVVDVLLRHGVDVNQRDAAGRTAIFYTMGKYRRRVREFLVKKGAQEDIRDCHGLLPMQFAYARTYRGPQRRATDVAMLSTIQGPLAHFVHSSAGFGNEQLFVASIRTENNAALYDVTLTAATGTVAGNLAFSDGSGGFDLMPGPLNIGYAGFELLPGKYKVVLRSSLSARELKRRSTQIVVPLVAREGREYVVVVEGTGSVTGPRVHFEEVSN